MTQSNKNIKIILNRLIGPVLFVWISYSIYQQILKQPDLHSSLGYLKESFRGHQLWKFLPVLFLMGFNWLFEAAKWKVLVDPLEPTSLIQSLKTVLAGLATGLGTPNPIGEYGGRALFMRKENRMGSLSATAVSSFSQLLVTMIFGVTGMFILKTDNTDNPLIVFSAAGVFSIVCCYVYFHPARIISIVIWFPFSQKILPHLTILEKLPVTVLLRVLFLSSIRYLIFVCQFILLLEIMRVDVDWWQALWSVSILYLILAIVPSVALLELSVRAKAGILLFQTMSKNIVGIYTASTGIWLVNVIVPAVIGSIFLMKRKIFNVN